VDRVLVRQRGECVVVPGQPLAALHLAGAGPQRSAASEVGDGIGLQGGRAVVQVGVLEHAVGQFGHVPLPAQLAEA
jgi:hypothetical protein